jgi:hypothetical protein
LKHRGVSKAMKEHENERLRRERESSETVTRPKKKLVYSPARAGGARAFK